MVADWAPHQAQFATRRSRVRFSVLVDIAASLLSSSMGLRRHIPDGSLGCGRAVARPTDRRSCSLSTAGCSWITRSATSRQASTRAGTNCSGADVQALCPPSWLARSLRGSPRPERAAARAGRRRRHGSR